MIGVIGRVLPAPVHTEESFGDGDDSARRDLFPEEAAVVAKAVPKRQREFAGVRACARRALARLGVPPVPLLPGSWDVDADGLLATGARVIYLCSVNNPTGTLASRAAVERILARASRELLLLISAALCSDFKSDLPWSVPLGQLLPVGASGQTS